MWRRSGARALLLLRSSIHKPLPPPPLRAFTRSPPPPRPLSRFLSSSPEPLSDSSSSSAAAAVSASSNPAEAGEYILGSDPTESGEDILGSDPTEAGEDNLASLWEEDAGDGDGVFDSGASSDPADDVVDEVLVARVRAVVEFTPEDRIPSAIADMVVDFTEPLLSAILQSAVETCSGKKLMLLFKSAGKNNPAAKSLANLEIVVDKVADSDEIDKMSVYSLWDLVKEMGAVPGSVNTEVLNKQLAMFWKLEKSKAALEVFDKFGEFGCAPDGDSYYMVIQAAGRKSMVDAAWRVCEAMIGSGCFPDGEKVGGIVTFLCKKKKVKEAHSVYLAAKEKEVQIPTSALNLIVSGLARNDETINTALELLEEYKGESLEDAGQSYAAVIHGLCKTNNVEDAKKVLMRMVNLGPAPGSAVFNFVITALSKNGEMEDAKGLMRVMENQGIQPDVYTYSVIMSGYTKGGMMEEAHDLLRDARKIHPRLSRVTYHTLIRGYCKMEEFEKALECLKDMKEDGMEPNMDEYNKLIQSLCLKALDWRTAENLLKEMEVGGLCLKGTTRSLIAAVKELEMEELSKASQEA
uniref:Pentacotripeptide-repeat region of PRORP domain-containing protein n=1 Tax=Leersia perrieri TaxID=77586 RepID=A0A0D9V903_9ORYZ